MELELGYSDSEAFATRDGVIAAIKGLPDDGDNFVILSRESERYIQVAGSRNTFFRLEYRDGSEDSHFVADGELTEDLVISAFVSFLEGNDAYRSMTRWITFAEDQSSAAREANPSGGCMVLVAAVLALFGSLFA